MWQPTWSPAPMPTDAKWCASRLARSSSSRKVSRRPSQYSASRSGTASTTFSIRSARLMCCGMRAPWSVLEAGAGGRAAVHGELGTRDVGGGVAGEEGDRLGDLLGLPRPLHRHLLAHPGHRVVVRDE